MCAKFKLSRLNFIFIYYNQLLTADMKIRPKVKVDKVYSLISCQKIS